MKHYRMLAINLIVSGLVMYVVMFTMIDGLDDFYNNVNMAYMTLTMLAPMGVLMLVTMRSMYTHKAINAAWYVGLAVVFVVSFAFTRSQTFVGDLQFIRSMIPHHSGAILMCRQAKIADAEIAALCEQIERSQRDEIAQMNAILGRLRSD